MGGDLERNMGHDDKQTLWLGPGPRMSLVDELMRGLASRTGLICQRIEDLGALLAGPRPTDLLLDTDHIPIEDLGIVRRALQSSSPARIRVYLTGEDPTTRVARELLGQRTRGIWLPWPIDAEALASLAGEEAPNHDLRADRRPPAGVAPPLEQEGVTIPSGPVVQPEETTPEVRAAQPESQDVTPDDQGSSEFERPRQEAVPTGENEGLDLERRLGRELRAIEAILRDEKVLLSEEDADDDGGLHRDDRPSSAREAFEAIELSPAEIEAFVSTAVEAIPESLSGPAVEERADQVVQAEAAEVLPRDRASEEQGLTSQAPAETEACPSSRRTRWHASPPSWYRAQIADLADIVQGLDLSYQALRESQEELPEEAQTAMDLASERFGGEMFRLVQFTRTLGAVSAAPGRGLHQFELATLVEEQLAGLAGSTPESPRFLFRSEGPSSVQCDKLLVYQALDAILHLADACSAPGDSVRVSVVTDGGSVTALVDAPAGPLHGLHPAEILEPYSFRRLLPSIGPNALAAASRILDGQGGSLVLERADGEPDRGPRLLFEVVLPSA